MTVIISKNSLIYAFLVCFPLLWLSGFHVLILPLALVVFWAVFKKDKSTYSMAEKLFAVFLLYAFLRIVFLYLDDDVPKARVLASLYNFFVILSSFLFYRLMVSNLTILPVVIKGASVVYICLIPVYYATFLFAVYSGEFQLEHPTLLGVLAGDRDLPGILNAASTAIYTRYEWGLGYCKPRSVYLAEYPTSAALLVALAYACFMLKNASSGRVVSLWHEVLVFGMLLFTMSRVVILVYLVMTVWYYYSYIRRYNHISFIVLSVIALLLVVNVDLLVIKIGELFALREGSSSARFESYSIALKILFESNAFFGIGFKPFWDGDMHIPVGSHSTVISMLLKFGVVGFVLFVGFLLISPLLYLVRNYHREDLTNRTVVRFMPVVIAWLLLQDLDSYVFPAFMVMIIFALARREGVLDV